MGKKVFFAPTIKKSNKKRISLRVPKAMLNEISKAMQETGYPPRDRSRWISDAITKLENNPDHINCIKEEWIEPGNNTPIQVSLTKDAEHILVNMIRNTQKHKIEKSDIQSSVVRTSIIHKILTTEGA